jgi:hypothetical protein
MRRFRLLAHAISNLSIAALICPCLTSCRVARDHGLPSIEFTRVPPSGGGNPDKLEVIEGRVAGAQTGDRIVLFARAGMWWVQPFGNQPFTAIQPDAKWKNLTHPGTAYAAVLVDSRFQPMATLTTLPKTGGTIRAVAVVEGVKSSPPPKTLAFSGYQWEIRNSMSNRAGSINAFDESNAWTDGAGLLHLRIAGGPEHWTSGEVRLSRSLGYGSYRFVVRDISRLEPAAVLSFFTRDDDGPTREMDIELSRWGELENKNAQYVVQPYFVAANTMRFDAPGGTLTHWLVWEPGRASFRTARGASPKMNNDVAEHVFSSGVPSPGNERVHMNLYVFDNQRNPLRQESEVIIEKFEFRP